MAVSVKLTLKHKRADGKANSELFYCNPAIINTNISSDTAVAVDNWGRSVVALTTDNYEDVVITQTASILEIINDNN